MTLTIQNYVPHPGQSLDVVLLDSSTGNTVTLTLDERNVGVAILERDSDMLKRLLSDVCNAVNNLAAVNVTIIDSGAE